MQAMLFHKKHKYKMDPNTANATLQNVFTACDKPSNTAPFDKLRLRQKLNTLLHDRLRILTVAILLCTILLLLIAVPAAKLLNKQSNTIPVTLVNDYMEDGFLYLELSGDNIQYEEAWMAGMDGETISGIYDDQSGQIYFPVPDSGEFNIYIPVKNDEPFHLLLTL